MKVNFDAAFRERDHNFGSRIVVRDSYGQILGSNVVINNNIHSPFATKALAYDQSLQWGKDLGVGDIIMEGGSLSVIKKIQSANNGKSLIGAYIKDCKDIGKEFHTSSFNHIHRSTNGVAHALDIKGLRIGIH